MQLPTHVTIKEVGPRDGLQNEKTHLSTTDKVQLVNLLSHTGLNYIEVTSFVHPKWIPQLADAVEVLQAIKRQKKYYVCSTRTEYARLRAGIAGGSR